jgi:hypothetical protein
MANITRILVEGDGDAKFVSDYISHIRPNVSVVKMDTDKGYDIYKDGVLIVTVQVSGGWTNIGKMESLITRYKETKNKMLLIYDADTNDNNGGYDKRKKEINKRYALPLDEIFLFPNNKDDGALEDLLEKIILQTNKPIFDCWDKFEDCLQEQASEKIGKGLTVPAKKSKIYVYLESLSGKTETEKELIKDANRNFRNEKHWNLNSNYLEPLRTFLDKYLVD